MDRLFSRFTQPGDQTVKNSRFLLLDLAFLKEKKKKKWQKLFIGFDIFTFNVTRGSKMDSKDGSLPVNEGSARIKNSEYMTRKLVALQEAGNDTRM